jgi:hypothetical protein
MHVIALSLLFFLFDQATALADEVELVPVRFDYARVSRTIDIQSTKRVVFYARSNGNVSERFSLRISSPRGSRVFVRGLKGMRKFSGSPRDLRRSYPISTTTPRAQQERDSQCIEFSPGEIADEAPFTKREEDHPVCHIFSSDDISSIATALSQTYGGTWTPGNVCGFIVDNYLGGAGECDWTNPSPECQVILDELFGGSPPPLGQARQASSDITVSGTFHRDACAPSSEPYIFAVYVDLSKVKFPPNARHTTVSYWGQTRRRQGGTEASIKPVSDGMYAPRPLLLMRSLGPCGQSLRLTQWNSSRPVSHTPMRAYDMLPYNGMILNRTPLGPSELRGGYGTFELSNSFESYGVCMSLVATRQRVNGYPGSGN